MLDRYNVLCFYFENLVDKESGVGISSIELV
jgi:hypothetical protein